MRVARYFVSVLLVTTVSTGARAAETPAQAADAPENETKMKTPTQIVDETVDRVLKILGDPEYKNPTTKPKLREKVRSIILGQVDMVTVSNLTLANYRKKFSPEQLKEFRAVFSQLLFSTYVAHLEEYTDEKVVTVKSEQLSESRVVVKTKTITDTKTIPVDYSFAKQGKRWMLYDVHIEGVSLVKNYRSQFRQILLNKSADEFLARLKNKVKENEANL